MGAEEFAMELPLVLYREVARELASSPLEDQFRKARLMILQEVLARLDPDGCGVVLSVLRCTPPAGTNPIRSLYSEMTQGTPPWTGEIMHQVQFFGAESLSSRVMVTDHAEIISNTDAEDTRHLFVAPEGAHSLACFPIKRFGSWAGVFAVASTFPLSSIYSVLLQESATLIGLTIPDQELYAADQMAFHLMPPAKTQIALLATYQRRFLKIVEHARQGGQSLSLAQARCILLQRFEEEFIRLPISTYSSVPFQEQNDKIIYAIASAD